MARPATLMVPICPSETQWAAVSTARSPTSVEVQALPPWKKRKVAGHSPKAAGVAPDTYTGAGLRLHHRQRLGRPGGAKRRQSERDGHGCAAAPPGNAPPFRPSSPLPVRPPEPVLFLRLTLPLAIAFYVSKYNL